MRQTGKIEFFLFPPISYISYIVIPSYRGGADSDRLRSVCRYQHSPADNKCPQQDSNL